MIGDVRIDVAPGPRNEVVVQDTGSGAILWRLAGWTETARWHVLPSADARTVYIQQLRPRTPTYLGTQTLDLRTGARLADDVKQELYWYENVVHWTALLPSGDLEMLVERSGRFEVRRLDGRDLKILATRSVPSPVPPPVR